MLVVTLIMINGDVMCSEESDGELDCSSYKKQANCNDQYRCSWFKGTLRSYCEVADCAGYNDSESSCEKAMKCVPQYKNVTRKEKYDCTGTGYGAKPRTCTRNVTDEKFVGCKKRQ